MKNIVVIVTDQLSFRALTAYGGTRAYPAIDGFFEEGTAFERAYTPCPLCMPARAAFWSSSWPHRTGVLSNGRKFPQGTVPESLPALGKLFANAGWEAVHFGKEHDAGALRGFTRTPYERLEVEQPEGYPLNDDTFHDRATVEQFISFLDGRAVRESGSAQAAGAAATGHTGASRPLLAVVDLNNPHNICGWVGEMARAVSGSRDFIPPARAPLPAGFPPATDSSELPELPPNFTDHDLSTRPRSVQYVCCAHNRQAQTQEWDETAFRRYLDAYDFYTQLADQEISRIMAAVRRSLEADDTLLVFFSDHGDSMTAHRGVTKHTTLYEETTRVPLAFCGPGITPGARIAEPVSLLDLVPTLADLAGIPNPRRNEMDGISLAPLLADSQAPTPHDRASRYVASEWHTEWGFTIEPGRMITDGRLKYMVYAEDGGEELYDLEADPYETVNLAPKAPPALEQMRAAMDEHLRRTTDPFRALEAKVDPRWRSHRPGFEHHRGIAAPQVKA